MLAFRGDRDWRNDGERHETRPAAAVKALVKRAPGPGQLALVDLPDPHPGPGQVVIRVMAGALCGTDLHIAHGTFPCRPPLVLGHELAGTVAEVGPGVEGVRAGDGVTTETDASFCGRCAYCRAGDMHLCPERTGIGTTADGGFAEYVAVPAGGVHRLPDGVDLAAGALTEPLAVAVHAVVERGQVRQGERVVVIGPGTVGLLAAQVALARGADVTVAGLARHADRFRLAAELGVTATAALDVPGELEAIVARAGGLGVDRAIECSGSEEGLERAIRLLRKGGWLVQVGFFGTPRVGLDLDTLVNRELTLVASRGKRPTSFLIALDLLRDGRVEPGRLITHRFPLDAWEAAFAAAEAPGAKVLLEM